MDIETLVPIGVAYAIGFYVVAFVMGMLYKSLDMEFGYVEWFGCIFWPVCIPMLIWILCKMASAKMGSMFPVTMGFVQRAFFAVSLLFRPVRFGEVVGKRISRDRA